MAATLLAVTVTACGGDGSADLPSPSRSITASLPIVTRSPSEPEPSDSPSTISAPPTESRSESGSESPSESPSEDRSPSERPTNAGSSSAPAEEKQGAASTNESDSIPSWVWWLVAALVLIGVLLTAILVPKARRRRAWDADLTTAEDEVTWLARELLPTLQQAGSPDAAAGGWRVAAGRVTSTEDRLTLLEPSAPDDVRRSRARSLRDAVRAARQQVENLLMSGDPAALRGDLAVIAAQLTSSLGPRPPTS